VIVDVAEAHPLLVADDGQLVTALNNAGLPAVGGDGVTLVMIAVGVSATAGGAGVAGRSVNDTC
jgi:hypothetical protein